MAEIQLFNASGAAGTLSAPDKLANSNAKMALIHQVAIAEAAGRRQGTSSTLRRDEVRGSGVKIRKQKGTGRSRQGDKRVPHMRGGGVVHGPKPRDYSQDTPRKMRQAAFRTVLNSRLQNDVLYVLDGISMSAPKTKEIVTLLSTMQLTGKKVLLLTSESDANITLSACNLPKVVVQAVNQTGITDVLRSEAVVCTRSAWDELSARIEGKGESSTGIAEARA
jgi:large subunit ribosomal protein L4